MRKIEQATNKDGTVVYRVRFRFGVSPTTGKMLQTCETFDTAKEAERFASLIDVVGVEEALRTLMPSMFLAPTMNDLAADHIAHLTGVTSGTRMNYERLWARTWRPLIGTVRADKLTRDTVALAINKLAKRYSYKSLKNQRGLLAGVCDRAVDAGHMKSNPTKRMNLPRTVTDTGVGEMRVLTQSEFARLVSCAHPHYRALLRFLGGTGVRWGEAVALSVADVNLDAAQPTVRIRRSLKWSPDNKRTIGPTKTKKSNRTIALAPENADDLHPLVAGRRGDELLFTAPKGGPVMHRTFWSDIWLEAIRVADIAPRPRIHDLRHSHASWLLGAGVPIHVVQARLGHESIQTTVDTYGSLMPDAQIAAAHAASLALSPAVEILELDA